MLGVEKARRSVNWKLADKLHAASFAVASDIQFAIRVDPRKSRRKAPREIVLDIKSINQQLLSMGFDCDLCPGVCVMASWLRVNYAHQQSGVDHAALDGNGTPINVPMPHTIYQIPNGMKGTRINFNPLRTPDGNPWEWEQLPPKKATINLSPLA